MTKKHYKLIAEVLYTYQLEQSTKIRSIVAAISAMLAAEFRRDNVRFNTQKFMEACGVNDV